MKVSIMQPYFFPYKNYFKLIKMSDVFVLLDDVQFTRTGWIHRNRFVNKYDVNKLDWLTLPLKKASRKVKINELRFEKDKIIYFKKKCKKFKFFDNTINHYPEIKKNVFNFDILPIDYLVKNLEKINKILNIKTKILLSSSLKISNEKNHFVDRTIEIVKYLNGSMYLNLPGGKKLYNKKKFEKNGIDLIFLKNIKDKKNILDCLS